MSVLSSQQVQDVCLRYQAGETSVALAIEHGVSSQAIQGLLKRRGIERRTPSQCSTKYHCDDHFFDNIDTEQKAYWLGFVAADGCIIRNALKITLSELDKPHLELLKTTLNSSHPIRTHKQSGYISEYKATTLYITSSPIVSALASHGLLERKTLVHSMPAINKHLIPHYLRGYVDGDGGFYAGKSAFKAPNIQFSVTSNAGFLCAFQSILVTECGLSLTQFDKRHAETEIYTLRYGGRLQVKRIFDYLYNNATAYLPRKRDKIQPYL